MQTLCQITNKTDDQVYEMDDAYATWLLIGNKKSINFESKFNELRSKQK